LHHSEAPESSHGAVITLSLDGGILDWDGEAARIFGWTRREALDQKLQDLIVDPASREDLKATLQRFARANAGVGPLVLRLEVQALRREGEGFPVEFLVTPLPSRIDPIVRVFARDLSDRREVDRMKDEFVCMVSHELRTPLTSIQGSLGLVAGGVAGPLSPQAKTMIGIAYRNCDRLVRLVNDILDVAKIESGKMVFNLKELDLLPVITQAVDAMKGYADKFQVNIEVAKSLDIARSRIDADRFVQVITNLISNAVKFSPAETTVELSVGLRDEQLEIRVTDRGPGIPEEFRSRIFQKFAQAKSSDTRHIKGTGLGLNISKVIVERMGGTIGFETQTGLGTTFFFTLPSISPSAPEEQRPARPLILHVEDDALTKEYISTMLQDSAEIVSMGTLEGARRWVAENRFDLLILDISLPDGDGLDLLTSVAEKDGPPPPVILFTAGEVPPFLSRLAQASFSKHSVNDGHLLEAVQRLLGVSCPAPVPA
jgi:PAS domain S-box-containing protein